MINSGAWICVTISYYNNEQVKFTESSLPFKLYSFVFTFLYVNVKFKFRTELCLFSPCPMWLRNTFTFLWLCDIFSVNFIVGWGGWKERAEKERGEVVKSMLYMSGSPDLLWTLPFFMDNHPNQSISLPQIQLHHRLK